MLTIISILIVFFSILLIFYFSKHPEVGFYLLIFSLPFEWYNIQTSFIALSISNILILILGLGLLISFLKRRAIFPHMRRLIPSLALISLIFLTDLLSLLIHYRFESIRLLLTNIGFFLSFLITVYVVNNIHILKRTFLVLFVGLFILSILTILYSTGHFTFGKNPILLRGSKIPFYANLPVPMAQGLYGMLMLTVIPLSLLCIFKGKSLLLRSRVLMVIITLLLLVAIFVPQSRGNWFAIGASILILIIMQTKLYRWKIAFALTIPLIIVSVLSENYFRYFVTEYIVHVKGRTGILTVYDRLSQYNFAADILTGNYQTLFFGIGYGAFEKLYLPLALYPKLTSTLHNVFLNRFVSTGLVGFLPFAILSAWNVVLLYRVSSRSTDDDIQLFSTALLATFIGMLVQAQVFGGTTIKIFWIVMALANSLYIIGETKDASSTLSIDSNPVIQPRGLHQGYHPVNTESGLPTH